MPKSTKQFTKLLKILLALVACNIIVLFVVNRMETGKNPRLYVVQSDSMRPAITTGDLIATVPMENYNVGDVITFHELDRDLVVTHRIVEATAVGQSFVYQTKGDANEDADTNPVAHEDVYGKQVLRLPYVGYVSAFAQTTPGFMLIVIIPALIIIANETKTLVTTIHQLRTEKGTK